MESNSVEMAKNERERRVILKPFSPINLPIKLRHRSLLGKWEKKSSQSHFRFLGAELHCSLLMSCVFLCKLFFYFHLFRGFDLVHRLKVSNNKFYWRDFHDTHWKLKLWNEKNWGRISRLLKLNYCIYSCCWGEDLSEWKRHKIRNSSFFHDSHNTAWVDLTPIKLLNSLTYMPQMCNA